MKNDQCIKIDKNFLNLVVLTSEKHNLTDKTAKKI